MYVCAYIHAYEMNTYDCGRATTAAGASIVSKPKSACTNSISLSQLLLHLDALSLLLCPPSCIIDNDKMENMSEDDKVKLYSQYFKSLPEPVLGSYKSLLESFKDSWLQSRILTQSRI